MSSRALAILCIVFGWESWAAARPPAPPAPGDLMAAGTPSAPAPVRSLTGQWRDSRGWHYHIRQVGAQVLWQAQGPAGALAVFHGRLAGGRLSGRWVGLAGRHAKADQPVSFRLVSWDALELLTPATALGTGRLERLVPVVPTLKLKTTTMTPGSSFAVSFTAPTGWPEDAWVGIVPAQVPHGDETVNDQHDLSYQYLRRRSQGVLTFAAPLGPGKYDVRMHDTDSGGVEVTHVTFEVVLPPPRVAGPGGLGSGRTGLKLKQTLYSPGQVVIATFEAPVTWDPSAWVGVVPAQVPHGSEAVNDQADLEYRYLNRRAHGQLTFTAPAQPGRYDLRMHDTDANGREITYVTFEVR